MKGVLSASRARRSSAREERRVKRKERKEKGWCGEGNRRLENWLDDEDL